MDPATMEQKNVNGDSYEVARTLASLGASSNSLRQSIEKENVLMRSSPDPLNFIDHLNGSRAPKTPPPSANSKPIPAYIEDYVTGRELRPRSKELAKSATPQKATPIKATPKKSILKMGDIAPAAFQGVDLTSEVGQVDALSWREPHPIFVIILVGDGEVPFGIQKDLLCAKAPYYRYQFAHANEASIEHIVKLPDTTIDAFGCFQNFLYSGKVYNKEAGEDVPEYFQLLEVWKLASKMQMPPLRVAVLNAMADRRMATSMIPGTRLLIQAWKETEEGSGLRLMLIGWAAEHMRANAHNRNEFARSLPQEILSELVITMSEPAAVPAFAPRSAVKHAVLPNGDASDVDHLQQARPPAKRARKSAGDALMIVPDGDYDVKPIIKKPARKSEPNRRASAVRRNIEPVYPSAEEDANFTPAKEMEYCRGLIDRMIQGPGFWTRLVGPFKHPVNPEVDQVPNYFDVVKRPMDLNTIRTKINSGQYASGAEFEADVRLIFQNCYEYWTRADRIWDTCEAFEKYFNEQWGNRHRWTGGKNQRIKAEIID